MHSYNTHTGEVPKHKRVELSPSAWSKLREKVWRKQHGLCAECGRWVRLDGDTVFNTAHLAHKKSRGAGGDDTEENTRMLCYRCHMIDEHGPRWSRRENVLLDS